MEVLTLSHDTAAKLGLLESLSPEQIGKMFRLFMQSLLVGEDKPIGKTIFQVISSSSLYMFSMLDEKWKGVLEALGTLLIEATRTNSTESQLKSVTQCGSIHVISIIIETL